MGNWYKSRDISEGGHKRQERNAGMVYDMRDRRRVDGTCPVCGKKYVHKVFNEIKNEYEFKHTKNKTQQIGGYHRKKPCETTYCRVAL